MKFLKLLSGASNQAIEQLVKLEIAGESYYYDTEAVREIILVRKKYVEKILGIEVHNDFIGEAKRVFLVVVDGTVYMVANNDVSKYLDALVAQLEIAEMAQAEG